MTKFERAMLNGVTTICMTMYWFALVLMFLHHGEPHKADTELDVMKAEIEIWKQHLNNM